MEIPNRMFHNYQVMNSDVSWYFKNVFFSSHGRSGILQSFVFHLNENGLDNTEIEEQKIPKSLF